MSLSIEAMREGDLAAALEIDMESFRPGDVAVPPDAGEASTVRAVREKQLCEELTRTWARLRVARRAPLGEVVGYVLFWHVVDEIHLLNVAVAPRARRQGIGRALVSEVIAYARANAAAKVLLEVRASNTAAIALYEELGFVRYHVRSRYYPDGEDGIEMMLETPAA